MSCGGKRTLTTTALATGQNIVCTPPKGRPPPIKGASNLDRTVIPEDQVYITELVEGVVEYKLESQERNLMNGHTRDGPAQRGVTAD